MSGTPLFLRNATPAPGSPPAPHSGPFDVLVDAEGTVREVGPDLPAPEGAEVIDLSGLKLSPGWVDLHTHCYWGATDISVRPEWVGLGTGVTTLVDAGSAGEANFQGFREYIAERADEFVYAFLNLGSIGLVACNRVSEIADYRSYDIGLTLERIRDNRDLIRGLKVRASHVILGDLGVGVVKIARKVAKISGLPLMVHVGEPPPLMEEVLEVLAPGDIVTHCFHGKPGGNILEDRDLFVMMRDLADRGLRLDIGHGGASFSFPVAQAAIAEELYPFSISSDLHLRNVGGPVFDLAGVMSKLLGLGMPEDRVIEAVTLAPRQAIGLETGWLTPGTRADLTAYRMADASAEVEDSMGQRMTLARVFQPAWAIAGRKALQARGHWG